jgi:hypothetical protein
MSRRLYMSVSEDAINKVARAHNALGALADLHGNIADKAMGSGKDGCARIDAEQMADLLACVQAQLRPCVKTAVLA